MRANGFSAMYCGEPHKIPFLPIVYLFTAGGHIVDALKGIYNIGSSTWRPLYIYIKEIRIHNNKREKSGQSVCM